MPSSPPPRPAFAPDARRLVAFDDLVGRQEIAERLGVTVAAVDTWRRRYPSFPEPVVVLSGTPIWRWTAVAAWARSTPRHRGRPRKIRAIAGAALAVAALIGAIALTDLDPDESTTPATASAAQVARV